MIRIIRPTVRKPLDFLSDRRAFAGALIFFVFCIFFFALLYWFLTPRDNGIIDGNESPIDIDFLQALYFSTVTISSLGYGDLRPVGWSKTLASIEVVLGLFSLGVMIASVTSRQVSRIVNRMFISSTRKQFRIFSNDFDHITQDLFDLQRHLGGLPGITPESLSGSVDRGEIMTSFRRISQDLNNASSDFRNYLKDVDADRDYFSLIQFDNFEAVCDSIKNTLSGLHSCLLATPHPISRAERADGLLSQLSQQKIQQSMTMLRGTCIIVDAHAQSDSLKGWFQNISTYCEGISDFFIQTPETLPDQVVVSSTTPEEP